MPRTRQQEGQNGATKNRGKVKALSPNRAKQAKPAKAASALACVRQCACAELVQNGPAIMRALREKAEEGSYLHARFLLDLVNETAAADQLADTENTEESLAAILLKHLQLDDENLGTGEEANEGRRIESQLT